MEDDLNFGVSSARGPKQGRRAKKAAAAAAAAQEEADVGAADEETVISDNKSSKESGAPPRPSRRQSGWGEVNKREDEEDDGIFDRMMDFDESERLRPRSARSNDSDDGPDIPVIPDLEDQYEEDMTSQVAMAPNVAVNRVATYRELDNDLLRHAQFLTLDNEIDLKVLSRCLVPESECQDEDKPWDWDRIFTEVTSELLTEWEAAEGGLDKDEEKTVA